MTKEQEIEAAWRIHEARLPLYIINRKKYIITRNKLAEAQNWRCCYCGVPMNQEDKSTRATIEHIIPRGLGGLDQIENYVVACRACNEARGNSIKEIHIEAIRALKGSVPEALSLTSPPTAKRR